jgi:nicotinamidase-related amidase
MSVKPSPRIALLALDCQRMIIDGYNPDPAGFKALSGKVLAKARACGVPVIYVKVSFRSDFPEVSSRNGIFSEIRTANLLVRDQASTGIPDEIAPQKDDVVIEKHRVGAFEGTELALVLRSMDIHSLVMFGIATSGCILSTVRHGADLDYDLSVIHDLCSDKDAEVHDVLMRKVLPSQAKILCAEEFLAHLTAR